MAIKNRKIYSLTNFRGLDKENKPLKVSPFRASEGENFIIDSETLKTRPAFKYKKTPLKKLDKYEIIDYYQYGELFVYVIETGFVIVFNDKILDSNTTPKLTSGLKVNPNFSGLRPHFQEEKDALFIFCLNGIYVVSSFYNETNNKLEHVVLYELSNKPANPFPQVGTIYFTKFEDLPKPYEPTLFIGDNQLDDVNLLSKVSKYKLFSQNKTNSQGGINTYYLPTHYNEEKHGVDYKPDVVFYKDKYKRQNVFPVFLGKQGENFTGNLSDYGVVENEDTPILVESGYVAKEKFIYKGKRNENPTPIKEILGLTKEDFFERRIKDSLDSDTVYSFLLNYAEAHLQDKTDNYVLKFVLPYERTSEYVVENESGNDVIEEVFVEQREEDIYIQFRYFETNTVSFVEKTSKQGTKRIVEDYEENDNYPDYPSHDYPNTTSELKEFYIGETIEVEGEPYEKPFEKKNFNINDFNNIANSWLEENKNSISTENEETIVLKLKMFSKGQETGNEMLDIPHYQDWLYSDIVGDWNTTPPYPDFDPMGDPVIELPNIRKNRFEEPPYNTYMLNEISRIIRIMFDSDELKNQDKGYAWAKFMWQSYYIDYGGTIYEEQQRIVFRFYYSKGYTRTWEERNSFVMTTKVKKEGNRVVDGLYELSFDKETNSFIFKCKDYFYDFNKEPAIDIKITFENNPDYEIISKSSFGTTFGSENRLFLAGNKEYPNIDRFNVSNDLLGNNIKNQSYELSYFPSKNYRVLGGRGAINGYVVSTDTQLYITKEDYPNDQKLFIRNRTMDDNGIVGYNEFKTNIERTPLNNRTLVRFYNDILILDKKGLFGLEITQNVLSNERMVKMRSGFINKDLESNISKVDKGKVFIYEDNHYMYMFVGKKVYVADSRYVDQNPNVEIGNYNYEIVVWDIPVEFKTMKKINGRLELLDISGKYIYVVEENNADDIAKRETSYLGKDNIGTNTSSFKGPGSEIEKLKNIEQVSFAFDNEKVYKLLATNGEFSLTTNNDLGVCEVIDDFVFRNIKDGDVIFLKNGNVFLPITVSGFEETNRTSFVFEKTNLGNFDQELYIDVSNERLYPIIYYVDGQFTKVILSPFYEKPVCVESESEALDLSFGYHNKYVFEENDGVVKDVLIIQEKKIKLLWISAVLDFGNNIFEKTMFRTNLYATKQKEENEVFLGYRTMRNYDVFSQDKRFDLSNPSNLDLLNFNIFAISTFSEMGASIPLKENNFLYIQYVIKGKGNIEINGIEVMYKLNRLLKSIG